MDRFEISVEKLVYGGKGLAFLGGKTVLVSGALPGEKVEAETVRAAKGVVHARALRILEAAPGPPRRTLSLLWALRGMPLPAHSRRASARLQKRDSSGDASPHRQSRLARGDSLPHRVGMGISEPGSIQSESRRGNRLLCSRFPFALRGRFLRDSLAEIE